MEEISNPYLKGKYLLVNKPLGWTSFQVVNKLKYALLHTFNLKKIKIGHAGTLDPLAEGLLIICTGKMTKQIESFQAKTKEYTGVVKLGVTTPSYDAETEEEFPTSIKHITHEMVVEAAKSFEGEIQQLPPIFSAIKKNGEALYKKARRGEKVKLKSRTVTFHSIEITHMDFPFVHFSIVCSKGTYIRSFAHDLGEKLGVGGYLTGLKRIAIGDHLLDDALEIEGVLVEIKKHQFG